MDKIMPNKISIFITLLLIGSLIPLTDVHSKSKSKTEFKVSTVVDNTNQAVALAFSPDWRLFYLEKNTGNIRVVNKGVLDPTPWATIEVDSVGERGLLGIAFDPYFISNGYVYIYHSVKDSQNNRVVRLKELDEKGTGLTTVLEIPDHISETNHNGGAIVFEPPNHSGFGKTFLYVSVGDGGGKPGRSQEDGHLLGKILKIDVRDLLPTTYYKPSKVFYAKGIRNSFGLAWNETNNTLYGTENGYEGRDEINQIIKDGNYGWPIEIGFDKRNKHSNPIWDFGIESIAPTGITFYPQKGNYPDEYKGNMFVTDYIKGNLYRIKLTGENLDTIKDKDFTVWFRKEIQKVAPDITFTDVVASPDGAIYLAGLSKILKIEYIGGVELKRPAPKFN